MQCDYDVDGTSNIGATVGPGESRKPPSTPNRQSREMRNLHEAQLAAPAERRLDDLAARDAAQALPLEVAVGHRCAGVAEVPEPEECR